jgi:predicted enzyme related to lactoylglutathione lyase
MATSNLMVVLYVHDMERAVRFYTSVLNLSLVSQSPGWSVLACGRSLIGLHVIAHGMTESTVSFAGLNLEVDDLDGILANVQEAGGRVKNIIEARRPRLPVRLAELEDSEGNGFELRQYVSW